MGEPTLGNLADGVYGAELDRRIAAATDAIRERLAADAPDLAEPKLVAVLGSGLGGVVELLDPSPRVAIPYRDIPGRSGGRGRGSRR